jgi:hypothetical protein
VRQDFPQIDRLSVDPEPVLNARPGRIRFFSCKRWWTQTRSRESAVELAVDLCSEAVCDQHVEKRHGGRVNDDDHQSRSKCDLDRRA